MKHETQNPVILSALRVCDLCHIEESQLNALIASGAVTPIVAEDGRKLFGPEQIRKIAQHYPQEKQTRDFRF